MKAETAEKKAKRLLLEQKQREKLLAEQNRKPWKNYALYLAYLIVVLTVIYIVDEIASAMNGTMQPLMIFDFFKVPGNNTDTAEYRSGATLMMALTASSLVFMLLTPFYKALADKFGRKLFLIINTAAMGFGLFVCFLAPHWAVYVLGIMIVQFVQTNDVQVIYIMETAPEKHRALLCNLTKAVALISVALIGVLRNIFYDPNVPSSWHMVFLIPAIVGMTVGLACIFLIRETPVFLKNRMEYLNMTDEERMARAASEKQKDANAQGGVMAALRYIFASKQLRRVCLAGFVFMIATGITSQYSTILERGEDLGTLTENSVDTVLIIYPFGHLYLRLFKRSFRPQKILDCIQYHRGFRRCVVRSRRHSRMAGVADCGRLRSLRRNPLVGQRYPVPRDAGRIQPDCDARLRYGNDEPSDRHRNGSFPGYLYGRNQRIPGIQLCLVLDGHLGGLSDRFHLPAASDI